MTRLADIYGPGFTQADYLRALAAGHETGWWDEHGHPAPWPDDFLDPTGNINPDWQTGPDKTNTTKINKDDQPPF